MNDPEHPAPSGESDPASAPGSLDEEFEADTLEIPLADRLGGPEG